MMFDNILFDLDGTLTDSGNGIKNSVEYALKKFGISVEDKEQLNGFIGPALVDSFQKYYNFDHDKALKAVEYYREYYSVKGIFENTVYDGVCELLTELKAKGKHLFVATAKPEKFAKIVLEHFDLGKYFENICGSTMDEQRKDKTQVIKYLIDKTNITLNSAVMVGDRYHDIEGAKDNNLASIGVLYGYGSREELESYGADYIVSGIKQLQDILLGE